MVKLASDGTRQRIVMERLAMMQSTTHLLRVSIEQVRCDPLKGDLDYLRAHIRMLTNHVDGIAAARKIKHTLFQTTRPQATIEL